MHSGSSSSSKTSIITDIQERLKKVNAEWEKKEWVPHSMNMDTWYAPLTLDGKLNQEKAEISELIRINQLQDIIPLPTLEMANYSSGIMEPNKEVSFWLNAGDSYGRAHKICRQISLHEKLETLRIAQLNAYFKGYVLRIQNYLQQNKLSLLSDTFINVVKSQETDMIAVYKLFDTMNPNLRSDFFLNNHLQKLIIHLENNIRYLVPISNVFIFLKDQLDFDKEQKPIWEEIIIKILNNSDLFLKLCLMLDEEIKKMPGKRKYELINADATFLRLMINRIIDEVKMTASSSSSSVIDSLARAQATRAAPPSVTTSSSSSSSFSSSSSSIQREIKQETAGVEFIEPPGGPRVYKA